MQFDSNRNMLFGFIEQEEAQVLLTVLSLHL